MAMTTANKITIGRLLLIPVFVGLALYYARSVDEGQPEEYWRWAAVIVFVIASISDGLDGFIARHYNQRSRLGVVLDPLADKGLLLSAIITLSLSSWPGRFPLWFPIIVVARDAILITGTLLIHYVLGNATIRPHWTGKVATFLQMVALAWVMLQFPVREEIGAYIIALAAIFTFVSGVLYIADGIRQVHDAGHGGPDIKY